MMLRNLSKTILFKITFLFSVISIIILILLGIIISKLIEQHFIEIDLDLINNHIARINNELKNIDKD
ncbi:MAG: hypothetical protein LBM64_06645, partial [Deltaproteobacteria bacterium]|nr:hypothetical protein [Deltaproteobacteria bacterium]